MIKLIELTFRGNLLDGFNVFLRISEQNSIHALVKDEVFLAARTEMPELYNHWKASYTALAPDPRIGALPDQPTNVSIEECQDRARELSKCFNTWLNPENFGRVREAISPHIRGTDIRDGDEVRIFLDSDDKLLQRLPWHLWDFLRNVNPKINIEFCLIPHRFYGGNRVYPKSNINRILAVFGDDRRIDVKGDLQTISKLPNSFTKFLEKPASGEIETKLGEQQWDILFFTGHSGTKSNGGVNEGVICINETQIRSIGNLSNALQDAIGRGLKLAIFNSCDGIALAEALLDLNIPQVVVMREPVANHVAEQFLKHFLTAFSNGASLYVSVRHARRQLQAEEITFPCASWLPMICQRNHTAPSFVWNKADSIGRIGNRIREIGKTILCLSRNIKFFILICLGTGIAFLYNSINPLVPPLTPLPPLGSQISPSPSVTPSSQKIDVTELISDGNRFLVNIKNEDKNKELLSTREANLVAAFTTSKTNKNWDETISKFKKYLYDNEQNITSKTPLKKNDPEALIYLNNAIAEKSGKYLTIAVSVPIVEDPAYLMGVSQEILRGVAQVQNEVNQGEEKQLINGNFLKVVLAKDDNASKNDDVVKAIAKKFVEDESILAVVGHNSTKASLAAADTYKGKLLAISPTSNGDKLSDVIYYRTLPSIATDAEALKEYAKKKEWKKIGICFDQSDESSKSLKESFANKFTTNGLSVDDKNCDFSLKEKINTDTVISNFPADFNALILLPSINGIDLAIKIAEANNKRKLPLLASSVMYTGKTLASGKNSVEGMVVATIWHPEFSKTFADSAQIFWLGPINWRTATSYDAMQVIIAGLKNNPDPIRKNLMEFVSSSKLDVESSAGIKNSQKNNKIIFKRNDGGRDAEIRLLKIVANEKTSTGYDFIPLD